MKLNLLFLLLLGYYFAQAQPDSDGLYFDGIDDKVIIDDTRNINQKTTNNRTYEMYFKAVATQDRQIIMKEGGNIRAVIAYIQDGYLILGAYNRKDYYPTWGGTFYVVPINANQWYHLALVFDDAKLPSLSNPMLSSANNALKFYLDGELKANYSGFQLNSHNSLRLGYKNETLEFPNCIFWWPSSVSSDTRYCFWSTGEDKGGDEYFFKGNIWGFRLWNDVRTVEEINDNKDTIIMSVGTDDLVAALDGDTMTYLGNSDDPIDTSVTDPVVHNWSVRASSSKWDVASNWASGKVPVSPWLESVIIPSGAASYPVIDSHVKIGDLTLEDGAKVLIKENGTLDTHYDLENNGEIKVENNGSLLVREGKPISGSGTEMVYRVTRDYPADFYTIWSTPLVKDDSRIGAIFTNPIKAFEWDAVSNPGKFVQIGVDKQMDEGAGYFIRSDHSSGKITRLFNGRANNGDVVVPIYYNNNEDNFNLLGNPYSSALNWDAVYRDNKDAVGGTIYYWKHTGFDSGNARPTDYIAYNLTGSSVPDVTGFVSTGLGVFTESPSVGELVFKNCHRVAGKNSQFFRTSGEENKDKIWLKLVKNDIQASILIGFVEGATNDYENEYDGKLVKNDEVAGLRFYTILEGKKLIIQGNSVLDEFSDVAMPIGFEANTAGNYSIGILKEFISDQHNILLEDKQYNTMTNLREQDYNFSLTDPVVNDDRFVLHFKRDNFLNNPLSAIVNTDIQAYIKDGVLRTKINNENLKINTIEIFDVKGQLLLKTNYNSTTPVSLNTGVYFVRYVSEGEGERVVKITNI